MLTINNDIFDVPGECTDARAIYWRKHFYVNESKSGKPKIEKRQESRRRKSAFSWLSHNRFCLRQFILAAKLWLLPLNVHSHDIKLTEAEKKYGRVRRTLFILFWHFSTIFMVCLSIFAFVSIKMSASVNCCRICIFFLFNLEYSIFQKKKKTEQSKRIERNGTVNFGIQAIFHRCFFIAAFSFGTFIMK